jgi:hypothetical protein
LKHISCRWALRLWNTSLHRRDLSLWNTSPF